MPRQAIYALLTKNGPTLDQQVAAIKRRVTVAKADVVYSDDLTVRRRAKDHQFPQRDFAIGHLRRGDVLVVASPGRLGIGREDIRAVLHALARKGNALLDASTGKRLVWTEEVADAFDFLDRGTREHSADILRSARAAKAASGIVYRPQPKALKLADDAAEAVWRDVARYSRDEAGAACGVSWRTLHNRFGGRTEAMGYRPAVKKGKRK